jgi:hypothetical protein
MDSKKFIKNESSQQSQHQSQYQSQYQSQPLSQPLSQLQYRIESKEEHQQHIDKLLIVMIGNMPTEIDSIKHWKTFIEDSKDNLDIVIHPQNTNQRENILDKWKTHFKNPNNFMVCDENYWVKTSWGNISLSLATLLAIEYAMKNKPFKYYRKIVFLQQCLPLYNFNVIKDEFFKDSKSWFKPREGEYPGSQYSQPYNFNRINNNGATIYDWNWWSAIFALDSSHFNIFFDDNNVIKNKYQGTYKKEGIYKCNGTEYDNIIPINKNNKYSVLFDQTIGSWAWDTNISANSSCINSDEVFFGIAFKMNFPGNEIGNHTRIINLESLNKIYKKNVLSIYNILYPFKFIYLFNDNDKNDIRNFKMNFGQNNKYPELNPSDLVTNLNEDIYIYLPRIVWLPSELYKENNQYPLYTGVATNYNPKHLKEYYNIKKDDEKINSIIEYGKIIKIDNTNTNTILEYGQSKIFNGNKLENHDIYNSKQYTLKNNYDQPVCYHDWTSFSINPDNIFRGAKFSKRNENNECVNVDNTNLYEKIDLPINDLIDYIIKNNLNIKADKLPIWHPVEYFTTNLKILINSYNIMSLCVECENSNWENSYPNLIKIIKFCWRRSILIFINYVDEIHIDSTKSYFVFKKDIKENELIKLKNMKIGTCLTEDILSSALTSGSLFIRKCITGCNISLYTNTLYKIQKYIPDISNDIIYSYSYYNKNKFGEFLYAPKSIFISDTYEKKYLKYKNKYLKLKNILRIT